MDGAEEPNLARRSALVAAFVSALIVLGYACHPIPAACYENDKYVLEAQAILAGHLPHDPYRPLLYPLLVAGLGWLLDDCFAAARIVSSVAAGVLVLASHALARRCFGKRAALLTAVLLAVHPKIVVLGIQAITDVLFTAAAVATLFFAVSSASDRRRRVVVLTGLCFAISCFTRYTAIALLAPVLFALLVPGGSSKRARLERLLTFSISAVLFLLPHFVLNQIQFGSPWHNEAWRSIALKYYGNFDWDYLTNMPFGSLFEVFALDPMLILRGGMIDFWWYLRFGLGEHLLGHAGSDTWIALGMLLLGLALGLRERSGRVAVGLVFALAYTVMICVSFYPQDRLMLPVIAFLLGAVASIVTRVRTSRWMPEWTARWASRALGGLLVLSVASQVPAELRGFAALHPNAEVMALRRLSTQFGDVAVLSTYAYASLYVQAPTRAIPLNTPSEGSAEDALPLIEASARECDARFVVMGPATTGGIWDALQGARYKGSLRILEQHEDVLVLTVANDLGREIRFTVSPAPYLGGTFDLDLTLADGIDPNRIRRSGVLMMDPAQRIVSAFLPRRGSRTFRISVEPPAPLPTGLWTIFPWIETVSGQRGTRHPIFWEVQGP